MARVTMWRTAISGYPFSQANAHLACNVWHCLCDDLAALGPGSLGMGGWHEQVHLFGRNDVCNEGTRYRGNHSDSCVREQGSDLCHRFSPSSADLMPGS